MARWIGASVLGSAEANIQGMVRANDGAALARYVDILRQEYRDASDAEERAMLAQAGRIAQAALVRMTGAAHARAGWQDRAAAIYAEVR
jgi:hypothetical protein